MSKGQTNPEILVIGGGVIGLAIARELHKKGTRKITVIDKGITGRGASWAAAGMLGPQAEADSPGPFFDLCCGSREMYPAFASELLEETGINVEFDQTGTLVVAFSDADVEQIHSRYKWQTNAGLSVELLSAADVRGYEPLVSPEIREALYFPRDWQVENRKLLAALRRYADIHGIKVIENTRVDRLRVEIERVIGAETSVGAIDAAETVLATGAWTSLINLGTWTLPFDVEPVRGQMIAFRPEQKLLRHVISSESGYVVPRADGRVLAGSTIEHAGFDASATPAALDSLTRMASAILPSLRNLEVVDQWTGLRPFAPDALPVLGRVRHLDGLFVATAHYRNGILLGPITARVAAENLLDRIESGYCKTFRPDRFGLIAGRAAS